MTSPVPLHPIGVAIIAALAAVIVGLAAYYDPLVGAFVAFVLFWGILERERQEVLQS